MTPEISKSFISTRFSSCAEMEAFCQLAHIPVKKTVSFGVNILECSIPYERQPLHLRCTSFPLGLGLQRLTINSSTTARLFLEKSTP